MNDSADTAKVLEAYIHYHSEKMDNTRERTVTAIQSGNGVLLFDDTGRGIHCMERYLQYLADNYFSSALRGVDSLEIYYFSTANNIIVEDSRQCAAMVHTGDATLFHPLGSCLLSKGSHERPFSIRPVSMKPDKSDYDNFLSRFNLDRSELMTDIARLDEIYKNGIDISKPGYGFIHENSFEKILDKLTHSYLKKSEHSPLSEPSKKRQRMWPEGSCKQNTMSGDTNLPNRKRRRQKKEARKKSGSIKL